jgi:hypothetical protein
LDISLDQAEGWRILFIDELPNQRRTGIEAATSKIKVKL